MIDKTKRKEAEKIVKGFLKEYRGLGYIGVRFTKKLDKFLKTFYNN